MIAVTVAAVFFSFALAYVEIYLTNKGLYVEVPFLNFYRHYDPQQVYGYNVKQVDKQRLFGFREIPSRHPKKEDQITLSLLNPLPVGIWITSFATKLHSNRIVFHPKSIEKFTGAAEKLGITKKDAADF